MSLLNGVQPLIGVTRVPLSTSFGRRPVYLASLLICFGSAIWRARAQTYGSFMGACVLNGIGAGPAEVSCDHDTDLSHTDWHAIRPFSLTSSPT